MFLLYPVPGWVKDLGNQFGKVFQLIRIDKADQDSVDLLLKIAGGFIVLIGFWQLAHSRKQNASERLERACDFLVATGPDGKGSDLHREVGLALLEEVFDQQRHNQPAVIRVLHCSLQQQAALRGFIDSEALERLRGIEVADLPARHPLSHGFELFFRLSALLPTKQTAPFRNLDLQRLELEIPYFEWLSFENCDLRGAKFQGQVGVRKGSLAPFELQFRDCILNGAYFDNIEILNADFSGSYIRNVTFENVKWIGAKLKDSKFSRTRGLEAFDCSFTKINSATEIEAHDFDIQYKEYPQFQSIPRRPLSTCEDSEDETTFGAEEPTYPNFDSGPLH